MEIEARFPAADVEQRVMTAPANAIGVGSIPCSAKLFAPIFPFLS